MSMYLQQLQCVHTGSKFGNKNSFTKKSEHGEENCLLQANFWVFIKCFSEFAKGIYETCDCNFFKFALVVVVFSTVQFILFLYFPSNLQKNCEKLWDTK